MTVFVRNDRTGDTALPNASDVALLSRIRSRRIALFSKLEQADGRNDAATQSERAQQVCEALPLPVAYQTFTSIPDSALAD